MNAAIGEISACSGVPLLDTLAEYEFNTPVAGSRYPVCLGRIEWLASVESLSYWTSETPETATPNGGPFMNTRISRGANDRNKITLVPSPTWPNDMLSPTMLVIVKKSTSAFPEFHTDSPVSAVILAAHSIYAGGRRSETDRAIDALIAGIRKPAGWTRPTRARRGLRRPRGMPTVLERCPCVRPKRPA